MVLNVNQASLAFHSVTMEPITEFQGYLFDNDFGALFPELFLVSSGIFLLVYGVIYSTSKTKNYPILLNNISWLSLLALLFTILLIINNPIKNASLLYNTLIIDDFTKFIKILVLLSSFFSIYISIDYIKQESINAFEYILLIIFSTSSMLFLISSADFISLYLAVELQSLCFYVLAAIKRNSEFSTEAGLKYFLLGAFSSGLLLFGCSLIYGFTGVTNFSELGKIFTGGTVDILVSTSSLPACELGMVFLLVGFLFKTTAAPFHMWSPDVYEGAPTGVTAFFMITPKAAMFAVFLRIFFVGFYDFIVPWQKIFIVCSLISLIVGTLSALSQTKIKRLLAFSSIGHVGYLLAGFACGTIEGMQALLIYLFVYIFMNINLFAIILCSMRREYTYGIKSVPRIKYITDLAFLAKTNPLLALTFTITMFSMAGIPPLAGFYSKAFLFFATMSSNLYVLAVIGVLASVLSCFYYIRLVKIMYFEAPKTWCSFSRVPRENAVALAISLFVIILLMAYPSPLHLLTHKVALALCL
jgi:proton-translocating NADH-quinone oxidoreductase chain N